MHMLTVIIAGLAMGATVSIANSIGAGDEKRAARVIGNTMSVFAVFSIIATAALILLRYPILTVMSTPGEAISETHIYILICFAGVPFITAYNVISSIFRGIGDTSRPLFFVFIAGVINIILDYIFIGTAQMGAAGAALATVISQIVSVIIALIYLIKKGLGFRISLADLKFSRSALKRILGVGVPIAAQDGFVQIGFLVITVIANTRGVDAAAAVGIVEKIISFLFLVPSAMLSSVSAIGAQNAGAQKHDRSRKTLLYAIIICLSYGAVALIVCELFPEGMVSLFTKESQVIVSGGQYLRSYAFDTFLAGIHFCFCGYFCAYEKAVLSFISNLASILLVRVPGAYLASVYYPDTLLPMGMAAPAGSLFSAVICIIMFAVIFGRSHREVVYK